MIRPHYYLSGLALLAAMAAAPAGAQTLCDQLNDLQGDVVILEQGTAQCRTSLAMNGARNMHCYLTFGYRTPLATETFQTLSADLAACLGPDATMEIDQSVNHPDAFELHEFDLGGRSYAVSIKDKGALQQTLVFVRVELQ